MCVRVCVCVCGGGSFFCLNSSFAASKHNTGLVSGWPVLGEPCITATTIDVSFTGATSFCAIHAVVVPAASRNQYSAVFDHERTHPRWPVYLSTPLFVASATATGAVAGPQTPTAGPRRVCVILYGKLCVCVPRRWCHLVLVVGCHFWSRHSRQSLCIQHITQSAPSWFRPPCMRKAAPQMRRYTP